MNNTKLIGLVSSLLTIAETDNQPMKYNQVITDLFNAENITNFVLVEHCGKPVISFLNSDGGISMVTSKQSIFDANDESTEN